VEGNQVEVEFIEVSHEEDGLVEVGYATVEDGTRIGAWTSEYEGGPVVVVVYDIEGNPITPFYKYEGWVEA
jgi:hypothetical protein